MRGYRCRMSLTPTDILCRNIGPVRIESQGGFGTKFPDNRVVLLAADVGGTKTLLGLYKQAPERPVRIEAGEFTTLEHDSLVPMIREFLKAEGVEPRAIAAATFGVAGAVTDQVARLTNVPWLVDAAAIGEAAGLRNVHLLNDLEAMAHSVPVLEPGELAILQQGVAQPGDCCGDLRRRGRGDRSGRAA